MSSDVIQQLCSDDDLAVLRGAVVVRPLPRPLPIGTAVRFAYEALRLSLRNIPADARQELAAVLAADLLFDAARPAAEVADAAPKRAA